MNGITYRKPNELKDSGIEWLGTVPKDWEIKKIKHVAEVFNGATPKTSAEKFWDGNINWFTPADFDNRFLYNSRKRITTKGLNSCGTHFVPRGTTLVTCRAPIGNIGIIKINRAAFNQGCKAVVPIKTDSKYAYYYLLSAVDFLKSQGQGTTFMELGYSDLANTSYVFPFLLEQHQIANFLDYKTSQFDSIIQKKEQLIQKLEEAKKSLISEVVTGKVKVVGGQLVPREPSEMKESGIGWLGTVPKDWMKFPIKALAEKSVNGFIDGDWIESPFITDQGIRLIQTGNIGIAKYKEQGFRYITEKTFKQLKCKEVFPNDVLICRLAEPVGRACLAPWLQQKMITSVDVCILKPNSTMNSKYIVYFLSSHHYLAHISVICRGSTRNRISRSQLGNVRIYVPKYIEQQKISNFLDLKNSHFNFLIKRQKSVIDKLKQAKQSLISEAVTGKIDLRDWKIVEEGVSS